MRNRIFMHGKMKIIKKKKKQQNHKPVQHLTKGNLTVDS